MTYNNEFEDYNGDMFLLSLSATYGPNLVVYILR